MQVEPDNIVALRESGHDRPANEAAAAGDDGRIRLLRHDPPAFPRASDRLPFCSTPIFLTVTALPKVHRAGTSWALRLPPGYHPACLSVGDAGSEQRAHLVPERSEEHTSELQSLMRISYAVFCLKQNTKSHLLSECHLST